MDVGSNTCLHVCPSASVQPVAVTPRLKRWSAPHVPGTGWYYIDVAIKYQRPTGFITRTMSAHHIDRICIIYLDRRKTRMVFNIGNIDRPAVHRITALLKLVEQ